MLRILKSDFPAPIIVFFYALLVVLLSPPAAFAHRINVFAWIEGEHVHVESKFSGGRAPVNALVTVYDLNGVKLLEGKTDGKGAFSYVPPEWKAMKITLTAGQGHKGEWILTESPEAVPTTAHRENASVDPTASMDLDTRLDTRIDKALDRKLTPILRQLKRMEQAESQPGMTDILGGIGYIIGLVGIAAYVRARGLTRSPDLPGGNPTHSKDR